MSTRTSGSSRMSAALRTRLIGRSRYRPRGPPSSSQERARTYCQRSTSGARVLPREQGEVRRAGRRRAAPPLVASRAFLTRPARSSRHAQRIGRTRHPTAPQDPDRSARRPSSSPRSSGARWPGSSTPPTGSRTLARRRSPRRQAIQKASGLDGSPGLIAVVDTPGGAASAHGARARRGGRARPRRRSGGGRRAHARRRAGGRALVARGRDVGAGHRDAARHRPTRPTSSPARPHRLEHVPGVTLGGPAVAGEQIGDQVNSDLGRAEMLAFPLLARARLLLLPRRPRRGASADGRAADAWCPRSWSSASSTASTACRSTR